MADTMLSGHRGEASPIRPQSPRVDVFETEKDIQLVADMPGVTGETLSVSLDGDTLLLQGEFSLDLPEGSRVLASEIPGNRYERSFVLSRELDRNSIQATIRDGVVMVSIAKSNEYQPRRIPVRTDMH